MLVRILQNCEDSCKFHKPEDIDLVRTFQVDYNGIRAIRDDDGNVIQLSVVSLLRKGQVVTLPDKQGEKLVASGVAKEITSN